MSSHRSSTEGYTIVEALIFLAVSGMLFVSAAALISGQQRKTEFTQAIRDVESRLSDISNDISTGLYTNNNDFDCNASGGNLTISPPSGSTKEQGGNTGCIYLGKVIEFSPNTGNDKLRIYTVVGKQRAGTGAFGAANEVTSISEATPQAIAPGSSPRNNVPDGTETVQLGGGATVGSVKSINGNVKSPISALGLISSFSKYSSGQLDSGSLQVDAFVLGSALNQTMAQMADIIADDYAVWGTSVPQDGVEICINSGGNNQHAVISIGGIGRRQFINTVIGSGGCPP